MIGLKRHSVVLAEHHQEWAEFFASEKEMLRKIIGEEVIAIEHVGSTAVPGLPAKPIIDIAVAVSSIEAIPALSQKMSTIGYLYRGDAGEDGGHLFIRESAPGVRISHLHFVAQTDPQWSQYLAFRDLLQNDLTARGKYADLKNRLVANHKDDRRSYTAAKSEFIKTLLNGRALQNAGLNIPQVSTTLGKRMMRKAESGDVADIMRVHVETWRQAYSGLVPVNFLTAMLTHLGSPTRFEFWRQQITHPDSRFFVASDDGRVIGWIQAGKSRDYDLPDESEIYAVYVFPSYWRQGIGSELIARVHLEVPEMNATTLWVLRNNQRAIDFYIRLGYYPDGATKEMTAGAAVLTEIRMRKEPKNELEVGQTI